MYYLFRYHNDDEYDLLLKDQSWNPYEFKTKLSQMKNLKYIKKHMQKTALLSYLITKMAKLQLMKYHQKIWNFV